MRTRYGLPTFTLALAAALGAALHRSSVAQEPASSAPPLSDAAVRGKAVFGEKCSICHSITTEKKIGPGLQGFYQRGTFTSDGSKVTDDALVNYLHTGKGMMPPFNDTALPPASRDDVIAYLKTL